MERISNLGYVELDERRGARQNMSKIGKVIKKNQLDAIITIY